MKKQINGNKVNRILKKATAIVMTAVVFAACFPCADINTYAARNNSKGTKLSLSTAKTLAVAKSEKIEALELNIEAKQAAKTSALKSLTEKQKNMSSFRWSPLLSFKLPTKPNEQEAYDFQYKPIQLQCEIDVLKHKIDDKKLDEYENVSNLFVDIVSCEEKIAFYTERKKQIEDSVDKLKARVTLGTASQADVDKAEAKLSDIVTKLSSAESKYQTAKTKLSNAIGIDVTTGYTFQNPFVSAELTRSALPFLEDYAVERDQTLYEAANEESLAMLSLRTNYSLMSSYYGSKINMISGYITKVTTGGDLDKRAFKKDYDAFLKKVDEPWQGNYKVWFIKFPKEWLKGSLDGVRYVEDDPYVLYQNAIDYQSARKEMNNTKADLIATVDDGYENYAETRKAYLTAVDTLKKAEEALLLGDIQYMLGQITQDEYADLENAYNTAVTGEEDALAAYSETTYNFDRTTCGGVSAFFASQNVDMTAEERTTGLGAEAGGKTADDLLQTLVPVYEDGLTYSIDYIADQQMFEIRIDVPSDFSVSNVNYYELWCDGVQVGVRTPVTRGLKHLQLATGEITTCEIYFYSESTGDDSFISKSTLDPSVTRGNLQFIKDYNTFTADGMVIGEFEVKNSAKTGTLEIKINLNDSYGVGKFAVKAGNDYKQSSNALSTGNSGTLYLKEDTVGQYSNISDTYSYLDAVSGDLEELTIEFTDEEGNKLFEAIFDTGSQQIVVPRDQLGYINNYQTGN